MPFYFRKKKIIGKSCYSSIYNACNAQNFGASYVAFGSLFNTKTKDKTNRVFLPNINAWNKIKKIPSVGIGGINIRNIIKVIDLQLEFVALSSSVWKSKIRPYLALKKIKKLIDNF